MASGSPEVLLNVLNTEEFNSIPEDVRVKLSSHFEEKFEEYITSKALFESSRTNYGTCPLMQFVSFLPLFGNFHHFIVILSLLLQPLISNWWQICTISSSSMSPARSALSTLTSIFAFGQILIWYRSIVMNCLLVFEWFQKTVSFNFGLQWWPDVLASNPFSP